MDLNDAPQKNIITIYTLNMHNEKPTLLPRDVFKKIMVDEWAAM
jgi:hypothetical protein